MSTSALFASGPIIWKAFVSTANANRTGAGPLVPLCVGGVNPNGGAAGQNGTRVDRVTFIPLGTVVAGTVRLFIDGVFYDEQAVAAQTASGTAAQTKVRWSGLGLVLPVGVTLHGAVNDASNNGWAVVVEGGVL
jgi:hypothetical protein